MAPRMVVSGGYKKRRKAAAMEGEEDIATAFVAGGNEIVAIITKGYEGAVIGAKKLLLVSCWIEEQTLLRETNGLLLV